MFDTGTLDGFQVKSTVGCFPEMCFLQFSAAGVSNNNNDTDNTLITVVVEQTVGSISCKTLLLCVSHTLQSALESG